MDFDHIYLSDNEQMLTIQYNPKITNVKWVTQESITNTLGGKYPIVRINGDTKYKQFSLSGTLYFNTFSSVGYDSCGNKMSRWMPSKECGYYLTEDIFNNYLAQPWKAVILEKKLRERAMEFLTNQQFKLFRSRDEGNLIVYLSNITFTPNATLGGYIYDFSATVTEVCEATIENLKKYNFNVRNHDVYSYSLTPREFISNAPESSGTIFYYTAYIDATSLFNDTVVLSAERVGRYYD
jgi:hypothetical protein